MEELKCLSCGGKVDINEELMIGVCEYCGTEQALPEDVIESIKQKKKEQRYHIDAKKQKTRNKINVIISIAVIITLLILILIRSTTPYLSKVYLTKERNYDDTPTNSVITYITPVKTFFVTATINNAKTNTQITYVWKYESKVINTKKTYINDTKNKIIYDSLMSDDSTWPAGDYRIEIYIGDKTKPSRSIDFKVNNKK